MRLDEIKDLNKKRIAADNKEKALAYDARLTGARKVAYHLFMLNHSGMNAHKNGPYFFCIANDRMLEEYLTENNLDGSHHSHWEAAYENPAIRSKLAKLAPEPYVRKTDSLESHVYRPNPIQQDPNSPASIPFSKAELLEMSEKDLPRFKALMHKGARYVAEINRILATQD